MIYNNIQYSIMVILNPRSIVLNKSITPSSLWGRLKQSLNTNRTVTSSAIPGLKVGPTNPAEVYAIHERRKPTSIGARYQSTPPETQNSFSALIGSKQRVLVRQETNKGTPTPSLMDVLQQTFNRLFGPPQTPTPAIA